MQKFVFLFIPYLFFSYSCAAMEESLLLDEKSISGINKRLSKIKLEEKSEEENLEEVFLLKGMINFKSQKYDSALCYLKKAAEYENNIAEYVLGRMYEFIDSYRDYKESSLWYELAARHGNKMAEAARERVILKSKKYTFVPNFIINYFDYYSSD